MDASIIIRTYNEARWLGEALEGVAAQAGGLTGGQTRGLTWETLLVDSGSTDGTVEIARAHGCRIETIDKADFTFGRSLNQGCRAARGRVLVFLSGHCIPAAPDWLERLCAPVLDGRVVYAYGRQIGRPGVSKFSEEMLFRKYYPPVSQIPQDGFFCNNANAALLAETWAAHPFDETVTGLEDLLLGKALSAAGKAIGYVAEAPVVHLHEESWPKVATRYEREAVAMQRIMPELQVGFFDFLRYTAAGAGLDWREAIASGRTKERGMAGLALEILLFRLHQYWGTYRGANDHRRLSRERKDRYYYPH
ncbi:MAG: glycosyltransferase family 2 protein [Pseudomonadota bacterium]